MSPAPLPFGLGVVEGFYGRGWTQGDRLETLARIGHFGYRYYIYAPKGDACLRGRWAERWPREQEAAQRALGRACEASQLRWGAGLSPLGLTAGGGFSALRRLRDKVRYLNDFGGQLQVILFDDMPADTSDLALRQAEIVHEASAVSEAEHLIVCPSYYSSDPVLETVFGVMPDGYISDFGQAMPAAATVFWTGDKVCSERFDVDGIEAVTERFGRPITLWDNYPVNDGARMSRFLHLDAFKGRPAGLDACLAAHFVNPMNQCRTSDIPLATLALNYRLRDRYQPHDAWQQAGCELLGADEARALQAIVPVVQDKGLDGMDVLERERVIDHCHQFDSPVSREILDWLDGGYAFDPACLTDQG